MKVRKANDGRLIFYCQGCGMCHGVNDSWAFNEDYDKPTFSPSVLVRGVRPVTDQEAERILNGENIEPKNFVCHSFVKDGKIQYLNDCTHKLAGQIVDLFDEENWFSE